MRRGSWHGIKGAPFGWDAGWHSRNVDNLTDRLVEVHTERRVRKNSLTSVGSSNASPRASLSLKSTGKASITVPTKEILSPTFSGPPHGQKQLKLLPRSALTGQLAKQNFKRKSKKTKNTASSVMKQSKQAQKLREWRADILSRPVRRDISSASLSTDSLTELDKASEDEDSRLSGRQSRLKIQTRAQSASSRQRHSNVRQRTRPATASRARSSKLHSGRGRVGSVPISQLGHMSGGNNVTSVNNTYSDFVRMLALFYEESDHKKIVEKACEDAVKLQEKMCLREYTG